MLFTADTPPPPELTGAGGAQPSPSSPSREPEPTPVVPRPAASQPPPPTIELELTDVGSTLAELERALAELEARPAPLADPRVEPAPVSVMAPEAAAPPVPSMPPPSGPPLPAPGPDAAWSGGAELPADTARREPATWRTWQLAAAAGGALLLGLGLGGVVGAALTEGGGGGGDSTQVAALEDQVRSLQDEIASQDQMIDDLLGLPGAAAPDDAPASGAEEADEAGGPADDVAGRSGAGSAGDEIVVGELSFTAIDVFEDFANDFEVRARMTHDGADAYEFLDLTATILDADGRILGVLSAFESDVQPGDTRTVSFIGIDDYTPDWAELEITVDAF
jgi:hypothetical protein